LQREADIRTILEQNTSMLFVTAGMGGGTGTGAAPVIAKIARELGILTVGIVTKPFSFEGRKRLQQAESGIEELQKYVDTMLVICNDKLLDLQGDLKLSQAFCRADDVLTIAAKGIAEIITVPGRINVDFEDVKNVMSKSSKAIMGAGIASGPNRAIEAVQSALASPLLDDTDIKGADHVLLYITSGNNEISLEELNEITGYITTQTGDNANVVWGDGIDHSLDDEIAITIIATGFDKGTKVVMQLDETPANTFFHHPVTHPAETIQEVTLLEKPAVQPIPKINEIQLISPEIKVESPPSLFENAVKVTPPEETLTEPTPAIRESIDIKPVIQKEPSFEIVNKPVQDPPQERYHIRKPLVFPNQRERESQRVERQSKLRELSVPKPQLENELEALEREPAYMRKKVELDDPSGITENRISRVTLDFDSNSQPVLKNNAYLHDKVD
jgi:cell division protein FtsZ